MWTYVVIKIFAGKEEMESMVQTLRSCDCFPGAKAWKVIDETDDQVAYTHKPILAPMASMKAHAFCLTFSS